MKKKIVTIGGGTGTYTLLRGLKRYTDTIDITAVVTMADSGGSTGRLRDEFGHLPVGDVRMALAALATDIDTHDELLRTLFLYRFSRGEGLSGHNFGNLFLTALTDILGSETAAIETAARVLRVNGRVVPVTTDLVHLQATYDDGRVVVGEHEIDEPPQEFWQAHITHLAVTPAAALAPAAATAILDADIVILGPGDLYTSILANCVVGGMPATLQATKATIYYVANLMSRPGQTTGMSLSDHVSELTKYCGRQPDVVIVNTDELPVSLVDRYAQESTYPVAVDELPQSSRVLSAPLLSHQSIAPAAGDSIARSYIRHDSEALARVLLHDVGLVE
jgi:uncharacterized cofD-like protein